MVAQTGCGPGEKCAVVLDDSGAQRIACAPDGTVALGGRCGSFAGVDDCVGGTACVNGTCREVCDPAQPGACPTPQTCTAAGTTGVGTCATLTSTTSPDSDDAPSTAAAPPPTSSGAACRQHQDCRPGTYCAADGTCHPDSHRPRGVTASPSLRNFRSGRVCTGPDGTQTVCQEAVDIVIDGRDQCEFNHEKVRCNWFGWEFDYENFDPSIPIRCAWVRSMPADEGNRDGIRQENATRGTSESWLPGACGHFISPGFQNYAVPRDGRRVVVNTRFDCSYDGKPLFDVEYRFHFGP